MGNGFCFNCGAKLPDGAIICPACGHDVTEGQQGMYAQQPQQSAQQPYMGQQMYGQQTQQQYAQPGMQQYGQAQYMQGYGQQQTMQPYGQQQYVQQPYYAPGTGYAQSMPVMKTPSVFSRIIGVVLALLGLAIAGLFGLGGLGLMIDSQPGAGIFLMILGALGIVLTWIGIRQFKPRQVGLQMVQQPYMSQPVMPQPQQPYQQPPQWGAGGYSQPQQSGGMMNNTQPQQNAGMMNNMQPRQSAGMMNAQPQQWDDTESQSPRTNGMMPELSVPPTQNDSAQPGSGKIDLTK